MNAWATLDGACGTYRLGILRTTIALIAMSRNRIKRKEMTAHSWAVIPASFTEKKKNHATPLQPTHYALERFTTTINRIWPVLYIYPSVNLFIPRPYV